METGKTTLSISAGSAARLTLIASSSPAPSPVRLSPVWTMDWSGVCLLLKKTKWASEYTLPCGLIAMAEASRSKSVPVVVRTSQPRPTVTAVRPGASLVSETLPPLDRLTAIVGSPFPRCGTARSYSYPYERGEGYRRFQVSLLSLPKSTRRGYSRDVDRTDEGTCTACLVRTSSAAPSPSPRPS